MPPGLLCDNCACQIILFGTGNFSNCHGNRWSSFHLVPRGGRALAGINGGGGVLSLTLPGSQKL